MSFVFSFWYIVALALVAGTAAIVFVLVKMDKKDKALINEFIATSQAEQPAEESKVESSNE